MSDLRPFRQRRAAAASTGPEAIDDALAAADPLSAITQTTALQPVEGDARLDFASEQDIASGAAIAVATAATPASTPARSAARSTRSLVLVVSALVVAAAAITAALYGMMRPKA